MNRKERCLNQESWQSGEKMDLCPETNSEDSAQQCQFKGAKEGAESQRIIKARG